MENFSIFDFIYDTYKIENNNPLRVIELFGGYGSQTLALKYLGVKYQHWKLCEWAIPSIIAYASLHRNELEWYGQNMCGDLTKEQIASILFDMGVSADYNKPATLDQLKRMPEEKLRLVFNSIHWANNLVDISRVKGKELNIQETEKFTYLLTYSFPCQDLSLAGKGKGMEKGSGTRSGLLWEVERILSECENKPQILVMENVTQVHGAGNEQHFKQWMLRLEEMGYQNYWHDLSATEFKIPQTRNRTFMVSILGEYNYTFPKKTKLELRLKDLLEPEGTVDEKYYISDKMINYVAKTGANGFNNKDAKINLDIARPLTTDPNKRAGTTNYLSYDFPENFDLNELNKPSFEEVYDKIKNSSFNTNQRRIQEREVCDTLCARDWKDPKLVIESLKIKNATKKGYLEAHEGDGVDISTRMESHRGTVQKDKAQTITTMGGENVGVVVGTYDYAQSDTLRPNEEARLHIGKDVSGTIISSGNHNGIVIKDNSNNKNDDILKKELCNKLIEDGLVEEYDVVKHSYTSQIMDGNKKCVEKIDKVEILGNYSPSNHESSRIVSSSSYPTVKENHGTVPAIDESELLGGFGEKDSNGGTQWKFQNRVYNSDNSSPSVTTAFNPNYKTGLRIRKLTPKECFRLMGLKDEDIDLILENQTQATAYHLAGDSIVTTCLMAIFSQFYDIDWKDKFKPEEWWKNEKPQNDI